MPELNYQESKTKIHRALELASKNYKKKNWLSACKLYNIALKEKVDLPESIHTKLGFTYFELKDWKKSIYHLRIAKLKDQKSQIVIMLKLASAYEEVRQYHDAIELMNLLYTVAGSNLDKCQDNEKAQALSFASDLKTILERVCTKALKYTPDENYDAYIAEILGNLNIEDSLDYIG